MQAPYPQRVASNIPGNVYLSVAKSWCQLCLTSHPPEFLCNVRPNTDGVFKGPDGTGKRRTHIPLGWGDFSTSFRIAWLPASLDAPPLKGQLLAPDRTQICWYLKDWRITWAREAPSTQPHPLMAGSPAGVIKPMITSCVLQAPSFGAQQACEASRE